MHVPTCAMPVLSLFRRAFSTPTYHRFCVLVLAAVLTTGRRTITNLLRTVREKAPRHMSSYHRIFSQRRWSAWALARALITFLLDHLVPSGPGLLAGDDTVTEHPGPQVFGKGRHRDGVRSTHSYTAYRWGHKWIVVSVLVKLPFATRPWALPVLVALYRPPEWDRVHGTRHRTPAHMRHLTLVSKFYGDAALYEPPPPRTRTTLGRPRVKGRKPASPQEVVAQTPQRTRLSVAWYGGTTRDIDIVTGTGHWYRIGEALMAIRWVYVHDCTGTHRDEYFFTTDLNMSPHQIVACYMQRWSIETTFQECREYLKLESAKGYGKQTVLRFTPCLFGLHTIVILLYLPLSDRLRSSSMISWPGKSTITFADMMACVRRTIWKQWFFQTHRKIQHFSKLSRSLQETILYALAPAA
jgi:DDE superfamily endonuclease/Archaeal putative transposase ISC1217